MEQTKEFMLVFRYEPNENYQPSEKETNEMKEKWGYFIGNIAIQEKLVSTHQLGFGGMQILSDKSIIEGIKISEALTIGGNMVVKANTIEQAAEMAKDCPILLMGGTVEVRDILPM